MCVVQQAVGVGTNNSYHSSSVDVHRTTVKLITFKYSCESPSGAGFSTGKLQIK